MRPRVYYDGARFLVWDTRHAYELRGAHRIVGSTVGALPTNKRQTLEHGMPIALLFEEALLLAEEGLAEVLSAPLPGSTAVVPPPSVTPPESDAIVAANSIDEKPPWPPTNGWMCFDAECPAWASNAELSAMTPSQVRLTDINGRLLHAQVFRALWQRGFYITCGSGFGADYLCYPGDPMRHHAHLLVHVPLAGVPPMNNVERACAARLANSVKKTAVLAEAAADGAEVRFTTVEAPVRQLPPSILALRAKHAAATAAAAAAAQDATASSSTAEAAAVPQEPQAAPPADPLAPPQADALAPPPQDPQEKVEVVLQAPLKGAPAVPNPRERTRRVKAPWEEGRPRGEAKRKAPESEQQGEVEAKQP